MNNNKTKKTLLLVASIFLLISNFKHNHKQKKLITYGTFDLFHHGHQKLFDNMVNLLGKDVKIYVGISSDEFNLIKNKKAVDSFETRSNNVKKHPNVVETFIENNWNQKTSDIKRINPDFFIMGSDWTGKFDELKKFCKVIYLPRTPKISSTILREKRELYSKNTKQLTPPSLKLCINLSAFT